MGIISSLLSEGAWHRRPKEVIMDIVVTGRRVQLSDKFHDVVNTKMQRVTKVAPDTSRIQIVVTHEGNPSQADSAKKVEITVFAGRDVIRAEASSADEFSALDIALDKLTLRLRRTRDRRKDHRHGLRNAPVPDFAADEELEKAVAKEENARHNEKVTGDSEDSLSQDLKAGQSIEVQVGDTPIVIRRKLHVAEPMTIDDAIYQMELIGHDFFLFVNSTTGRPSVVYRRHGWSYGVFEIDTAENLKKERAAARKKAREQK
jgi:ribosomal subunit interface protein